MYKYVSLLVAIRESDVPGTLAKAPLPKAKYEPDQSFLQSLPKSDWTGDVTDSLHLQETSAKRAKEMQLEGRLHEELENSSGFGLLGSRLEELRRRMLSEEVDLLPFGVYTVDTLKDESVLDNITASGTTDLTEEDSLGGRFQPEDLLKTPIEEMHHHTDDLDKTRRQSYDNSMIQMLEEMVEDKMATFKTFVATDEQKEAREAKKQAEDIKRVDKQLDQIAKSREKKQRAERKGKFDKKYKKNARRTRDSDSNGSNADSRSSSD